MAEKEYIEREARLREIDKAFEEYGQNGDILRLFSECRASILFAPTADVVEVRHGEWVHNRETGDERCTVCGFEWWGSCQECGVSPLDTNYCPNCGAKMDGKGESRD